MLGHHGHAESQSFKIDVSVGAPCGKDRPVSAVHDPLTEVSVARRPIPRTLAQHVVDVLDRTLDDDGRVRRLRELAPLLLLFCGVTVVGLVAIVGAFALVVALLRPATTAALVPWVAGGVGLAASALGARGVHRGIQRVRRRVPPVADPPP